MEIRSPGEVFVARVEDQAPGLVGTIRYRIVRDSDGVVVTAYTTLGIGESSTGVYDALVVTPSVIGLLRLEWDAQDGTVGPKELLLVAQPVLSALPPSGSDVFEESKLDFTSEDNGGYPDGEALQPIVDQAVAYIEMVTGRPLNSALMNTEPTVVGVSVKSFVAIARQAVRMRTEQVVRQANPDYIEDATDDIVGSFSAGGYSQTKRDPNRRGESHPVNSWPALDELLWMLMTPSRYDYWWQRTTGKAAPAMGIEEIDWNVPTTPTGYGVSPGWLW